MQNPLCGGHIGKIIVTLLFCFGVANSRVAPGSSPVAPSSRPLLHNPSDIERSLEQCLVHAKGKVQNAFLRFSVCHSGTTSEISTTARRLRKLASTAAIAGATVFASRTIASRWVAIKAGEEVVCDRFSIESDNSTPHTQMNSTLVDHPILFSRFMIMDRQASRQRDERMPSFLAILEFRLNVCPLLRLNVCPLPRTISPTDG
jgi:hypothetical protein